MITVLPEPTHPDAPYAALNKINGGSIPFADYLNRLILKQKNASLKKKEEDIVALDEQIRQKYIEYKNIEDDIVSKQKELKEKSN